MLKSFVYVAILVLCLCSANSAQGEFAVLQLITNIGGGGAGHPTIGWEFAPVRPILITKLGYYDSLQNGLTNSHQLGIFEEASHVLLTSTSIAAGIAAPLEGPTVSGGGFRYVPVTPLVLNPGMHYIIAATPIGYIDNTAQYQPIGNAHYLETAPDITFIQGRYNFFVPPGLAYPVDESPNVAFGPSFQFTVVPEPSTLTLLGIAIALVAVSRKRHLRQRSG